MARKKEEVTYSRISADILSFEKGVEHFDGLKAIRIVSRTYNLLILVGYLSLIGEIDGDLFLISDEGTIREFRGVTGFYKHSKDAFEFILKGSSIA